MEGTKQKLAVGFLIDRWQPTRGGAERALAELARFLEDRGHRVDAFAALGPRAGEEAPGAFHRVAMPLAHSRGARAAKHGRALVAAAAAHGCDVTVGLRHLPCVDLYWPHGGSHAATIAALREARGLAAAAPRGRHGTFLELERTLLEGGGARAIVCVSRLVRDELARAYPSACDRMVLAPNGVDTERFHPRERENKGAQLRGRLGLDATPLVVFAARVPELKGLPALLTALARIPRRWNLLVAGPRDVRRWQRGARACGLPTERVRVVADADAVALAAAADLCVLPTWRDPCGLVVLEALSSGTPVVTTRRAGAAEQITSDSVGSVLDDPGDVGALAATIEGWLARIERGAIDRAAIRGAVRGLEREAWLHGLETLLLELAASRNTSAPIR